MAIKNGVISGSKANQAPTISDFAALRKITKVLYKALSIL